MAVLPKVMYRFNGIPVKIQTFSTELEKNPNLRMESQEPRITKADMSKAAGIATLESKLYYKATNNNTCQTKTDTKMKPDRKQNQKTPYTCSHLILTKWPKIHVGEKITSLANAAGKTMSTRRLALRPCFSKPALKSK